VVSIPSRSEAARILLELNPPDWFMRHSSAVAEVAAFLAVQADRRGTAVDRRLVDAAALLHDVDKLLPDEHPLKALGHGEAGAAWLSQLGHAELARAVAGHPATLLTDERRYPAWARSATVEERIVAYADKRATQDLVPLERRFGEWQERHPESAETLVLARRRAEQLEQQACAAAGIEPAAVERLAWVDDALRAASR
jgi:putative nucleotidyltransferase with HDIG domain